MGDMLTADERDELEWNRQFLLPALKEASYAVLQQVAEQGQAEVVLGPLAFYAVQCALLDERRAQGYGQELLESNSLTVNNLTLRLKHA